MKNFNVKDVASKINLPVSEWEGNCYAVSVAMVNFGVVVGVPRYGHFLGEIHPESIFYIKSHIGFVRHGWIEMPNKTIVDPTRFTFETKKPYIYVGKNDFYDVGGNSFRDAMRESMDVPVFDGKEKQDTLKLSDHALTILHSICKEARKGNNFTRHQLFWIANANPNEFGKYAIEIYHALDESGNSALVPIDNYDLVMTQ